MASLWNGIKMKAGGMFGRTQLARQEEFAERNMTDSRLGCFDFFAGLGPQELSFIAANCKEMQVSCGELLIQQGQVGQDVYLLESGSVRVFRGDAASPQGQTLLEAPTILGEMALVDPERIRNSSVIARSDLRLLRIPISTFLVFVRSYPSLKESLRQLLAVRSAKASPRMN